MAWIHTIDPDDADGLLRTLYDEARQRAGKVFNVVRLSSLNPPALRDWVASYKTIMFAPSPLSRAEREMTAVVVSWENGCRY